jgi:hypothetical protein
VVASLVNDFLIVVAGVGDCSNVAGVGTGTRSTVGEPSEVAGAGVGPS